MLLSILNKLGSGIKSTASNHKKKLIFIAILIVGYKIARRKIKTQNVVSIVMFFMKVWAKIVDIFPMPSDPNYRHLQPFTYVQEMDILQMVNVIQLKSLLTKIKNKQPNALEELKVNVLSGVILNISLYKMNIIYELIHRKYANDFADMGAGSQFEQSINLLKSDFVKNLPHITTFISNQIGMELSKINLSEAVNVEQIRSILNNIIKCRLFSESVDINEKILSKKTYLSSTEEYKIADNYFRTSKEYEAEKSTPKSISIIKEILISPFKLIYKGMSEIFKAPEQNLTTHRFQYIEYLYILPIKKFKTTAKWPNLQSNYLFGMVLDQIINFLYSINFNIVLDKKIQFNLNLFMNRVNIYFLKRAKCQSKKFMDLLPIFYKIVQEQMINQSRRQEFYQRELLHAFRDTKYKKTEEIELSDIRMRNKILQQIYFKNQIQHLQKDMQAKLYNQRDGLELEPVPPSSRFFEEKDQIQQLMEIHNRADEQKPTTREQMQLMRELMN